VSEKDDEFLASIWNYFNPPFVLLNRQIEGGEGSALFDEN